MRRHSFMLSFCCGTFLANFIKACWFIKLLFVVKKDNLNILTICLLKQFCNVNILLLMLLIFDIYRSACLQFVCGIGKNFLRSRFGGHIWHFLALRWRFKFRSRWIFFSHFNVFRVGNWSLRANNFLIFTFLE